GRELRIGAVHQDPLSFATPEVQALDRILVADERASLDDCRASMEVDDVPGAVEPWRRVEDVVALVLHDRPEAGPIEVHRVEVGTEARLLVRLLGERKHDRLARWMQDRW